MSYEGEATIRFTRIHSNQDLERPVEIEVMDAISGDMIAVLRLSDAEFGRALSQPSEISCEVKVYTEAHLGMKYESKYETIPWKPGRGTAESRRKAVEPFEIDGWEAQLKDLENHHNWGGRTCQVRFTRYTPLESNEVTNG